MEKVVMSFLILLLIYYSSLISYLKLNNFLITFMITNVKSNNILKFSINNSSFSLVSVFTCECSYKSYILNDRIFVTIIIKNMCNFYENRKNKMLHKHKKVSMCFVNIIMSIMCAIFIKIVSTNIKINIRKRVHFHT